MRATNGKYTYALLDTGCESTLIRSDFAKRLNLRKNSKTVNISSTKDSEELINVDEVELYVTDEGNTSSLHINKALVIKRERFNLLAQFLPIHFQQNGEWVHLQRLKLANINPGDVMVVIGTYVSEAFIQLSIRKGKESQQSAIQTPFGWMIFGCSKKCSSTETPKGAVNTTMLSSELKLNDNVKNF